MYYKILFIRFPEKNILFLFLVLAVLIVCIVYYYARIYDNKSNEYKAKNKKDISDVPKKEAPDNPPVRTDIAPVFPDSITMINTDISYGIIEVIAHFNKKQKIFTKLYFDAEILSDAPVVLGRGQKNELSLPKVTIPVISSPTQKSSVSMYHATLSYNTEKNVFILTDGCNGKPSRNGTFFNGAKINEISLFNGISIYPGLNNEIELKFYINYVDVFPEKAAETSDKGEDVAEEIADISEKVEDMSEKNEELSEAAENQSVDVDSDNDLRWTIVNKVDK